MFLQLSKLKKSNLRKLWYSVEDFIAERVGHTPVLDKPIFLVGCSKSGTTLLGALFTFHPDVGPKLPGDINRYSSYQELLDEVLKDKDGFFIKTAYAIEQIHLWEKYFPFAQVKLNIGKELALYENPLTERQTRTFLRLLSRNFHDARFFTKQPWNTFRVHMLRQIFPDAKIIAIHRDGRDVVTSWGRYKDRWNDFGGYANAITTFSRKWSEAIDHIEVHKQELDIYTIRYEDLLRNHTEALRKLFAFCELPYPEGIYEQLTFTANDGKWKKLIPSEFHPHLQKQTAHNLERLGYICQDDVQ
jgi:hypothetical protein